MPCFKGDPPRQLICDTCKRMIEIEDAYAVLTSTYVCAPDIDERCLGTWNNREFVRSEFYD